MALFKKGAPASSGGATLGSGRRLHSSNDLAGCLEVLEGVLRSYRPPPYVSMRSLTPAGWAWAGPPGDPPPSAVYTCTDEAEDVVYAAFWPEAAGTTIALIPLGSGDDRLSTMPLIGHWKQRDASLSSTGTVPPGVITPRPPSIPPEYIDELLSAAGFPATPSNRDAAEEKVCEMLSAKAYQFLESTAPGEAERFVDAHRWSPGASDILPQRIVDDLAARVPAVLPYIQDLPLRIRALLLEAVTAPTSFWSTLDRTAPAPPTPAAVPVLPSAPAAAPPPPAPPAAAPPVPLAGESAGPSGHDPATVLTESLDHVQRTHPHAVQYRADGIAIPGFELTSVLIDVTDAGGGATLVNVRAPLVLGLTWSPGLVTWVGSRSGSFDFGSVRVYRVQEQAPAQVDYELPLFGNNLSWRALDHAISTVEAASRQLVPEIKRLFGGHCLAEVQR